MKNSNIVKIDLWNYVETPISKRWLIFIRDLVYLIHSIIFIFLMYETAMTHHDPNHWLIMILFHIVMIGFGLIPFVTEIPMFTILEIYAFTMTIYLVIKHEIKGTIIPYHETAQIYKSRKEREYPPIVNRVRNILVLLSIALFTSMSLIHFFDFDIHPIASVIKELSCFFMVLMVIKPVSLRIVNTFIGN